MSSSSKQFPAVTLEQVESLYNELSDFLGTYQNKPVLFSSGAHKNELAETFVKVTRDLHEHNLYDLPDHRKVLEEMVSTLENHYNNLISAWSKKKDFPNTLKPNTLVDMFNCMHLNLDPKHHSSSRKIGLILKKAYELLGDQEKQNLMSGLLSVKEVEELNNKRKLLPKK